MLFPLGASRMPMPGCPLVIEEYRNGQHLNILYVHGDLIPDCSIDRPDDHAVFANDTVWSQWTLSLPLMILYTARVAEHAEPLKVGF